MHLYGQSCCRARARVPHLLVGMGLAAWGYSSCSGALLVCSGRMNRWNQDLASQARAASWVSEMRGRRGPSIRVPVNLIPSSPTALLGTTSLLSLSSSQSPVHSILSSFLLACFFSLAKKTSISGSITEDITEGQCLSHLELGILSQSTTAEPYLSACACRGGNTSSASTFCTHLRTSDPIWGRPRVPDRSKHTECLHLCSASRPPPVKQAPPRAATHELDEIVPIHPGLRIVGGPLFLDFGSVFRPR